MLPNPSRLTLLASLLVPLGVLAIPPALAQTPNSKPQTAGEAAKSIVTDPLEDTNIQSKKIPAALSRIGDQPYSRSGTQSCQAIAGAVAELDAALGPDFDEPRPSGPSADAKAISTAKDVALGFIPGRGLIREVSGANKAEQRYAHAVYAGMTRRAFLKGIGAQRGCKAPAAPKS